MFTSVYRSQELLNCTSAQKIYRQLGFNVPFFLNSGLPFLTVARTMSPDPAVGSLLRQDLIPKTAMMYRFLAPEKWYRRFSQHLQSQPDNLLIQAIRSWGCFIPNRLTLSNKITHTWVISTVHDGSDWETQCDSELSSSWTSASYYETRWRSSNIEWASWFHQRHIVPGCIMTCAVQAS